MEYINKIIFFCIILFLFIYIQVKNKHEKIEKKNKEFILKDSMKLDIPYQWKNNREEFKSNNFTDEEVVLLSSLLGLNIPRPDPFVLKNFLGTTLDKKQIPLLKANHLCVKMHKYKWKYENIINFEVEIHYGEPVVRNNEVVYPYVIDNFEAWLKFEDVSRLWPDIKRKMEI